MVDKMVNLSVSPLVVIVGPTASGKSALAIKLAKLFNGEIICADSWTVYKDFDIGTAKPGMADLAVVPHHLLDVTDAKKGFSAALFKDLANEAINDVSSRKKLPFLVGGTGLYIDSVIYDYSFLPPGPDDVRERLNGLGISELLTEAKIKKLDTSSIDVRNKRRIIRLIENNGRMPDKHPLRQNTLVIGLTVDPELLKSRITERVNKMIEIGLEQEVKGLVGRFGYDAEPMKGIGYQEWRGYFEDHQTLDETKQRIIKSTIDLVKRQRTWFKRNKSIHWVEDSSEAVELITTYLNKKQC